MTILGFFPSTAVTLYTNLLSLPNSPVKIEKLQVTYYISLFLNDVNIRYEISPENYGTRYVFQKFSSFAIHATSLLTCFSDNP